MKLLVFALMLFVVNVNAQAVVMNTSMGEIEIELNAEKAPKSVENFLKYVDEKFYDGTIFHRVIKGFMIQGGGFDQKFEQKKTKAPVINEGKNGLKNVVGSIAMARTGDPDSATSQFFINIQDNASLDYPQPDGHGYAVFGKVVKGMDVVNRIKEVRTGSLNGHQDVPMDQVIIKSVSRKKSAAAPKAKTEAKAKK